MVNRLRVGDHGVRARAIGVEVMVKEPARGVEARIREGGNGPLRLRDAYFGGRTGPLITYYKPGPDEEIAYLDVNSLYPHVWWVIFTLFA